MTQDSLNYWLVIIVAYLYFDSWVTTFRLKAIHKRLKDLEEG
jgi:ABC-type long-subunit fatty acid transport system fused permease/ATPase subunit